MLALKTPLIAKEFSMPPSVRTKAKEPKAAKEPAKVEPATPTPEEEEAKKQKELMKLPSEGLTIMSYLNNMTMMEDRIKKYIEFCMKRGDIPVVFTCVYSTSNSSFKVINLLDKTLEVNIFLQLMPKVIKDMSEGKNTFTFHVVGSTYVLHAAKRHYRGPLGWSKPGKPRWV